MDELKLILKTYIDKVKAEAFAEGWNACLEKVPTAQPKIIRCKDCKWCVEHYDTDGNAPYWICKNWDAGIDADGFCYEAERRTDTPNKHIGEWAKAYDGNDGHVKCTACFKTYDYITQAKHFNYCPNCGARMVGWNE